MSAAVPYRASAYRWRFAAGFCAIAAFTVTVAYYLPARRELASLRAERAAVLERQATTGAALERARAELAESRAAGARLEGEAASTRAASADGRQRIEKLTRLLSAQFGRLEQAKMLVVSSAADRVSVGIAVPALFVPSSVRLTENGTTLMCSIVETILEAFKGQIRVTGYYGKPRITDPVLAGRYANPWQLTAARAASTTEAIERACGAPVERFLAVGYGPRSAGPLGENVALEFIFRPED